MSAPRGWPPTVPAPESEGWEAHAAAYLFDLCPAEHRAEPLLQRHPVVLARITRLHVSSALEALRKGYGRVRVDFAEVLRQDQIETVLAFYEAEGRRLRTALESVELIEAALRGTRYTNKL